MAKGHNLNDGIFFRCESCGADTLHSIDFIAEKIEDDTLKDREPHSRRCLNCGREEMFRSLRDRVQAVRKVELNPPSAVREEIVWWCRFCLKVTNQTLYFSAAVVGRANAEPDTAVCSQCKNQSRYDPHHRTLRQRVSEVRRESRRP